MQWFRMYSDAVDDEKLRLLAFEDRWHFVAILCLKASGVIDGDPELLERKIAVKLGLGLRELDEVKRRLYEVDLISPDWQPIAWDRRQYKHDDSAPRVRAFRERQKVKRGVTVTVTGSDTESEAETEKNKSRASRSSRLPDGFMLTRERRLVAEAERLPAERTFAKFVDYWRSVSGARGRKLDWDATWRNWCRNEADRNGATNGRRNEPRKTRAEQAWDDYAAEYLAGSGGGADGDPASVA